MALVVFESRVNMLTVATPSVGGYVIAYDSADGILKQKNDQGVITPIAGSSSPGSLTQTLAIGNTTGTFSINLGAGTKISSVMGGGQLKLDNGIGGANIVNLSTDYGALVQSYLYMTSNAVTLKSLNASLALSTSSSTFQLNSSNVLSIRSNNYFVTLNGLRVIDFTTATSSTTVGNRVSALISTNNSKLNTGVYNTVVLGGTGITGATSNSVYVPNLYVQNGGFIKGTDGTGKLTFNSDNEVFLTSDTNIIGILGANSAVMGVHNGIFISDNIDTIVTTPITSNTFISTSNTTIDPNLTNVIVIGGDGLYVTQSNTTYIGGTVSIGNAYTLPTTDGVSGQVIQTDGSGNTFWGSPGGSVIEITAASFSALAGTFDSNTTYKVLDADTSLYDGTEIYLTTNASGVLNEKGIGKFYNPLYNQSISGFGIWSDASSYSISDFAFWGGKAWINNSSTNNDPAVDIFTLNSNEWDAVPFDDPYSSYYYAIVYDEIKYDWENDLIIYRNEKNSNIVSANKSVIDHLITGSFCNPIKAFQWGNLYDRGTGVGIGQQNIINSYNENINFAGDYQIDVRFTNYSKQYNCLFINGSSQETIVFDNSEQYDSEFDGSGQANIVISNQSYQNNLNFVDSLQQHIILDNNSWQDGIQLYSNSSQIYLNFDDNSYQDAIYLENSSEQTHINFSDNSYQTNLTETTGLVQHSVRLDNYGWNRYGQTMTANEEDLTLTGSKLSYQTPFGQTDRGIGEIVFFGTASSLVPGYIYQFTTGEWKKADLATGASASGLLAIALGAYVSDGLLLRGYATFDLSPYGVMTLGSILYLNSNGTFNLTPTSTSGEIVRVIGYCVDEPVSGAGTLYFCPDTTWIEIA